VEGLNTVGAFSSPAFNGTSIAKSSYQSPIAPQMAKPLNLADPTRGHKPQGVNKDGTKVCKWSSPDKRASRLCAWWGRAWWSRSCVADRRRMWECLSLYACL
jgi:hypothetical protein